MFYSSFELRYFYDQEPKNLINWFSFQEYVKVFPARTDRYLVFSNSTKAGVKFREGRFEIKSFVGFEGELRTQEFSIPVESWEKWSSPELFSDLQQEGSEWLDVTKSRSLLTLIDGKPVQWQPDRPAACNAELSEVSVNDQSWWTFNLEAYGADAFSNLKKGWDFTQKAVLQPEHFADKFRMSYPEWLCKMHG